MAKDKKQNAAQLKPAGSASKEKAPRGWGKSIVLFGLALGCAGAIFGNGNPTQRVGMLLSLMKSGLPGAENTTAFDDIYENGNLEGNTQQKKAYDADVANSFYNLATKFYEVRTAPCACFALRTSPDAPCGWWTRSLTLLLIARSFTAARP